jgi:hypothetical protein
VLRAALDIPQAGEFSALGGSRDTFVSATLAANALTIAPLRGRSSYFFPAAAGAPTLEALEAGACITTAHSETALELSVVLPPEMPVGEYVAQLHLGGTMSAVSGGLAAPEPMMLLFNPWSEETDEYIPDEAACDEYVMNEDGYAHYGAWNRHGKMPWNYGQFEPSVLAAARKLLASVSEAERATPVGVSRAITRQINHQGGGGVLSGNWSGDYVGEGPRPTDPGAAWVSKEGRDHPANAQPPTHWNGSVEILKQWVQSGGEAVCYGQCWVFAGITTSLLRCVGLGARQVASISWSRRPILTEIYLCHACSRQEILRVKASAGLQLPLRARHPQQPHDRGVPPAPSTQRG